MYLQMKLKKEKIQKMCKDFEIKTTPIQINFPRPGSQQFPVFLFHLKNEGMKEFGLASRINLQFQSMGLLLPF